MPKECEKCIGKGLIGNGDQPHLMQGAITTCPDCKGSGKLNEDGSAWSVLDEAKDPVEEVAPVDNSTVTQKEGASIVRRILQRIGL